MRIALVTDGIYPYVIGGMQKHSFYLAKYFAQNSIYVDLYHTSLDMEIAEKIDCFSDSEKAYITSIIIPFPKADSFPGHYIREMRLYSSEIYKVLQKRAVDFIYVQGLSGLKFLENRLIAKTPIGVNFHGLEMFQKAADVRSKTERLIFRRPVLRSLKNAEVVFSLGGKLTNLLLDKGIEKKKIIQIPIGIDPSWIRTEEINNSKKRIFVFVGRYERRKGIEELTKVLKQIVAENFEFKFIGAIPEEKQIRNKNVTYYGAISDVSKIKNILKTADVLVCPSYSEGMPTVILEAMASGLAIIASDVGAVSELVNEKNGILIEPGNIVQIKNSMIAFLNKPEEQLIEMKKNSIKTIEKHFLWETIIKRTIFDIKQLV